MKKINFRILSLILATSIVLVAGCGGSEPAPTPAPDAGTDTSTDAPADAPADADEPKRDTIVVATADETPSISPWDHNSASGGYIASLTHDSLFDADVNMQPIPNLVSGYENISDTIWQFTLKEGIKFHNGDVMTAEDVVASIEHAKTYPTMEQVTKNIGVPAVVDELTFTLTTEVPYANMLLDLCDDANKIVPKALIDSGHDFGVESIGSGPYKLVEWKSGEHLTFVAFDEYHDGAPSIENVIWRVIPEGSSRTIALEAGEVDLLIEVETTDIERLKENSEIAVLSKEGAALNYVMINNTVAPFDNVLVRKAINTAINRDSVVTVALDDYGSAATAQVPNPFPGHKSEGHDTYNIELANQYMTESGVDPATIEFPIICSDDVKRRAAEVIQSNLKDIGINAEIVSMDLATYLSATSSGDYTAAIGGYNASSMLAFYRTIVHSSSIGASNRTRFSDPAMDALIDEATVTIDPAANLALLEEIAVALNETAFQIPLYHQELLRAYNADLVGVDINAVQRIMIEDISWK